MIGKFFFNIQKKDEQKKLILGLLEKLDISKEQKFIYREAIKTLPEASLGKLYYKIKNFVENLQKENLQSLEAYEKEEYIGKTKKQANKKRIIHNDNNFLFYNT